MGRFDSPDAHAPDHSGAVVVIASNDRPPTDASHAVLPVAGAGQRSGGSSRLLGSRVSVSASPVWYASTTAWTRPRRLNFWVMWVMCVLTVVENAEGAVGEDEIVATRVAAVAGEL